MLQPELPPPTHTHSHGIRSFPRWLVLSFLGLAVGCGLTASLLDGIRRLLSMDTYPSHSLELASLILCSSIAGVVVALVIGSSWQPPLHVLNRHWLGVNILGMSAGTSIGLMTYYWVSLSTFPIAIWLLLMATIGSLFGYGQWLILRQQTRLVVWWIAAVAISWTRLWMVLLLWSWGMTD